MWFLCSAVASEISGKLRQFVLVCCVMLMLSFSAIYISYDEIEEPIHSILVKVAENHSTLPLSLHCNKGRLGNQMCSYATLFGLSLLNHRSHLPLNCNNKYLSDIFVGPNKTKSVDETSYPQLNPWKILPYFKPEDAAISENSNFINGYLYPCSYTFFDHSRNKIRQAFQFRDHFKSHAQEDLREANIFNISNVTYVGIHVRRGDYQKRWLEAYEAAPVNLEYFQKALKHFRDKYTNTIFVAISDDRQWCRDNLVGEFGVYVPKPTPSPAHDLAVLANCNHTIMTYGTFGFWGAYLAGGEVLYFDKFLKPNTTFALEHFLFEKMYPLYWKGVVTIPSSYWVKKVEENVTNSNTNISVVTL